MLQNHFSNLEQNVNPPKIKFRNSTYVTLKRCGRYYHYKMVQKLPEYQKEGYSLHYGTSLHKGLDTALLNNDKPNPEKFDLALLAFESLWDKAKEMPIEFSRYDHSELHQIAKVFLDKFVRFYAHKFTPIFTEKEMNVAYDSELYLNGTIDAFVEFEGKNTLVDYKTTMRPYPHGKAVLSSQLLLYGYMLTQLGYRVDQVMFLPFVKSTGGIQNPLIAAFDYNEAKDLVDEMILDFKMNLKLNLRNPNSCEMYGKMCGYYELCTKKGEEREHSLNVGSF